MSYASSLPARRRTTRGTASSRSFSPPLLSILVAFCCICSFLATRVEGKRDHGDLKLSSIVTEQYLTKFAANEGYDLTLKLDVSVPHGFWNGRHALELDIFSESGFRTFKTKLDKGSLCDDRVGHAHRRVRIARRQPDGGAGRRAWNGDDIKVEAKWKNEDKSQVYYFYVTDCALEWYNAKDLPSLKYDLEIKSETHGHLPSDEWGLLTFNLFAALLLSALFAWLLLKCLSEYQKHKQIHVFVLIVGGAYALQILSLVCEACHLIVYNWNGRGLRWRHTFFALDFVSEIAQGTSEHLVALLLIFLGCGWTTMNLHDLVQSVSTSAASKPTAIGSGGKDMDLISACVQAVKGVIQSPKVRRLVRMTAKQLGSPVKNIFNQVSLGGVFVVFLTFVNLTLEMLGRQYHDEFSQFHDHEHWPGKCILLVRVALWLTFITGAFMTYSGCKKQSELRKSMKNIALFGSIWLLAFPVSVVIAEMMAPRWRHRFVYTSSVLLQLIALQYLVYLCFFSRSFTKISSIAVPSKANTLPSESVKATTKQAPRRRALKVAYD